MARIALVFSGGGASASFEVGVLQELRKTNILPLISIVSGASAGGLNAVAVASGQDENLEKVWTSLTKEQVFRERRLGAALAYLRNAPSLYSTEPLRNVLQRSINFDAIRHSKIMLRVVASDLLSGKKVIFDNTNLTIDGLMATTAIPGLFPAIDDGDRMLVDGGTQNNVPIGPAIAAGADVIICVISEPDMHEPILRDSLGNFIDKMIRGAELAIQRNMKNDVRTARLKNWEPGKKYVLILDIVPQRKLSAGFLDFDREKIVDTIAHGAACAHAFFNGFADKHATSFREFLQNYHPPEFRFLRYRCGPWREKLLKLIAGC
ncbi:hypothetical protein A3J56_03435 [Candidatus Giovannonibacteria bacterium RIFCSPHIGHO2_02_FULL_46_20]|uniref:PNPLA domain-containing protein n=1 Tax=Candidatus Giovannonibacteria bacterium RIFCSPHIGHO2_02_FULL_46_20 TaxID=1798338 RepID=A0A1F5WFX0_9BACT|nr:MAG: hypothetical protein A3J56_03435 [Candidatus Giovannonibacteria bacterium RIFCSPHIGHO2_02_FULL_46_20]